MQLCRINADVGNLAKLYLPQALGKFYDLVSPNPCFTISHIELTILKKPELCNIN